MIARAKNTAAQYRPAVESPCSSSSRTANTGTTASRSTVSALGRLTSFADCGGVAAGSGITALMSASPPDRYPRGGDRYQVHALGPGDLGGDQLSGHRAVRNPEDRGGAVGVRVLVRGGAEPRARALLGGQVLHEQHLDHLAEAVLGPL